MSESRIVAVDVDAVDRLGEFGGAPYQRVRGTMHGLLAPDEDIVGIDLLPMDTDGCFAWRAEFEVLRGADGAVPSATVVDSENRGGPSMLGLVAGVQLRQGAPSTVEYPEGMGEGCLFDHGLSYARIQWQTGHADGVPARAQGVGLAIVRDFGRLLAGTDGDGDGRDAVGRHERCILTGASQSAWFVNTFVAEGFNDDPGAGGSVYTGAFPYLSAGNWLAINRLADDGLAQDPYVRPDGTPLTAAQLLTRPRSDPFLVEMSSYTEYYRMRASVFASAPLPDAPAGTTFRHRTHPGHRRSQPPRSRCSVATAGSKWP